MACSSSVPFSVRIDHAFVTSVCIQPRVVLLPRVLPLENVGIPNDVPTDMLMAALDALHAVAYVRTPINVRIAAFLCLSFCVTVHGVFLSFGLKASKRAGCVQTGCFGANFWVGFLEFDRHACVRCRGGIRPTQ